MLAPKANTIIVFMYVIKWSVWSYVHLLVVPFLYKYKPIYMFDARSIKSIGIPSLHSIQ